MSGPELSVMHASRRDSKILGCSSKAETRISQQPRKVVNAVRTSLKLMSAAIMLPLVVTANQSVAIESDHESRDRPKLIDRTCEGINFAYMKLREQSLYRETIFELKADGTLQEHMKLIFHGPYVYQKAANGATWDRLGNDAPYWQRFTSCTPKYFGGDALYYATYHKDGHLAGAEVWTTTDGGTIKKVIRRYPNDDRFFSFPTAVSVFDYRQKAFKVPEHYTCGGTSCGY